MSRAPAAVVARAVVAIAGPIAAAQIEILDNATLGRRVLKLTGAKTTAEALDIVAARLRPPAPAPRLAPRRSPPRPAALAAPPISAAVRAYGEARGYTEAQIATLAAELAR